MKKKPGRPKKEGERAKSYTVSMLPSQWARLQEMAAPDNVGRYFVRKLGL